jgi:multidrug efflux pump subunit AcrA (membrane-fusion protein)
MAVSSRFGATVVVEGVSRAFRAIGNPQSPGQRKLLGGVTCALAVIARMPGPLLGSGLCGHRSSSMPTLTRIDLYRDMSQRYLTLVADVEGENMGRASRQVAQAVAAAGDPPLGVRAEPMGQLPPTIEMSKALGIGLAVAVFVIFVLLRAYFQSPRLALISVGAVLGVLAGIATILYFSNTSLIIESFMCSIMCLGVSVSNSVMLVTFMDEHWKGGASAKGSARRLAALCLVSVLGIVGCGHKEGAHYTSVAKPPTVRVIQPEERTIVRVVGQPSFIESYERTSVYPKLTGYIEKWNVDIGDKVKKGDVLATLFVPELVEDFGTKKATVKLDEERVALALKLVEVADADVKAAKAKLDEAKAILAKYESEVSRWDMEVKRLTHEVQQGVVDPQILLESTNQWRSSAAARDAAKATIAKAEAELLSRQATLAKAHVDVDVAKADLAVATSEAKRIEAWVGYITLPAPYDGIVMERNANTGDFVLPSTGDPSTMTRAPHLSPSGNAAPIYVVMRTDIVRIFVDVPEADANYVHGCDLSLRPSVKDIRDVPDTGRDLVVVARVRNQIHFRIFDSAGKRVVSTNETQLPEKKAEIARLKATLSTTWPDSPISPIDKDQILGDLASIFGANPIPVGTKASVLVRAFRDEPIPASVARTSWALNVKSRTLRAEIDLANHQTQLLPGMYAYARVIIERPGVMALPVSALTYSGDRTYCWMYQDGHAVRSEIQTGVSDGDWIEVTNLQQATASKVDHPWKRINGTEKVILGDLSILAEGAPVEVVSSPTAAKVADAKNSSRPPPAPGPVARTRIE